MAEYFALTSGKGGTGKSTLCAAIAKAMAARGKRVLIADMDIGLRSLDLLLQLENKVTFDLGDIVNGSCQLSQALFPVESVPGLWLICAPLDTAKKWDLSALIGVLSQAAATFDCVFIDAPAGLGLAQLILRLLPAKCLLVTTPDHASVRDNAKMRDIAVSLGREPFLLVNRVSRAALSASGCTDFDRIADDVSAPILAVFPEDSSAACVASDLGNTAGGISSHSLFGKIAAAAAMRLQGETVPLLLRKI